MVIMNLKTLTLASAHIPALPLTHARRSITDGAPDSIKYLILSSYEFVLSSLFIFRSSAVCYFYRQKPHQIHIGAGIIKNCFDKSHEIKSDEDCKCS
ncbi:Uncharacterised protein [uncultured archaeon]|nr:Uncharacterised protein [uncultured archaeon]